MKIKQDLYLKILKFIIILKLLNFLTLLIVLKNQICFYPSILLTVSLENFDISFKS
jgi:hypothetical protein